MKFSEKIKKKLKKIINKFFLNYFPQKNSNFKSNHTLNHHVSPLSKIYHPYSISDSSINDYTYIASNSKISLTEIGKFCSIGPNFLCGYGIHPTNGISTSPSFYSNKMQNGISFTDECKIEERKKITIGNDVFIGMNVSILDGVTIGDGAVIGAGAVVTKNVEPYAIFGGVPAKLIKYRFDSETIEKLLKIKWWNWEKEKLKEVEKYFFDIKKFIENNT
jgi:acetyltransferase-like isoleucine patch superfamily enzyme